MKIHFIGIGGIGTSALALYYLKRGHKVTGSDLVASEITHDLKKRGVKIFISNKSNLPRDLDLVVFSPAVPKDNPAIKKAKKNKIKCLSYPQALGELTKQYFTIAVSGTHGKSTTTAMLALVLVKAGLDPTVIVGTKVKEFDGSTRSTSSGLTLSSVEGSNCRIGKSRYLVIEADEHMASFLNYRPQIIVLTNIEREHLDFYKNLSNILKTFKRYISFLPSSGILVANKDDKNISKLKSQISKLKFKIRNYSIRQEEAKKLEKILKVPGKHNIYNAMAVLTVARELKIRDKTLFKALSEYRGVWRRFEVSKKRVGDKNITLVSDYAHHPTEVKATISALFEKFGKKKIICIFQPHQYQRVFYLFNDFVKVFRESKLDKVIIIDIFDVAGREKKSIAKKVNAKMLVETINRPHVVYLKKEAILNHLKKELKGGEVITILGAGDIYKLLEEF